jgi:hypothetical protein
MLKIPAQCPLLSNSVHDSRWQGFQLSPALHRAYRQCSISALQCRLWVIRCVADQGRRSYMSVVGPIGDKMMRRGECS